MTDKQIIIDGCDVSGCKYYKDYTLCCSRDPNCNYKKYKRKEQECETLASQLDFEVQKKECLEQECERLSKGYAELTDIVAPYMDDFTGYNEELGGFDLILCVKELLEQLDQLKTENEGLKKNYFTVIQQRNKAEKTLTEIKEIAKKN